MTAPACVANAVADALGVDEVELPLTPARVWELLPAREAVGLQLRACGKLDEAAAALAEAGGEGKAIAGPASCP